MLTYCSGTWPGGHPDMLEAATSALPTGVFQQAMHWISVAHLKAYMITSTNSGEYLS
ncbi:beta-glucosidase-like chloroplastic-like [Trifolium pratense]|uniref:Beta-glucosidase-like chloroplastic-like n=1 Tax=Trifolium pratense TaxID=57577 RepID=A0A2K3JVU1_TRIPR|nr:beta-glucosidase-like chloroplastic-like [Trifolium pratense]